MRLREAIQPVVDFVYPPRCLLCGGAIGSQSGLCAECWGELAIPGDPSCALCQRPLGSQMEGDAAICGPCLASPPRHDGVAAATLYNDASRRLVLAFKHGRRLALAKALGQFMVAKLDPLPGDWLVVPVPLHRARLWQRGFNQSVLLGREVARKTGARLVVDGLVRRKATPSLGGLGAKARIRTLSGAIAVKPSQRDRIRGARVILVDDVLTSGATSDARVSALKRAGAEQVRICCFARVMDEALDSVPGTQNARS